MVDRYPPATSMETITSEHPTIPTQPAAGAPVVPRRSPARAALKTARPQEWIKNVFVFAGLLFSGKFNQSHEVVEATLTFVAFCAISSAGYYVNDLLDVELDRKHPKKRFRPLAAGELSRARGDDDRAAARRGRDRARLRHRQLGSRPDGRRLRQSPRSPTASG